MCPMVHKRGAHKHQLRQVDKHQSAHGDSAQNSSDTVSSSTFTETDGIPTTITPCAKKSVAVASSKPQEFTGRRKVELKKGRNSHEMIGDSTKTTITKPFVIKDTYIKKNGSTIVGSKNVFVLKVRK